MFRYRIYGQAFTLAALVGGSYYYNADRLLRREWDKLQQEKKAKEKHEAWIRELEVRDREDQDWRERMGKVRDARRDEAEKRIQAMEARKSESGGGGGAITMAMKMLKGERKPATQAEEAQTGIKDISEGNNKTTDHDGKAGTVAQTVEKRKGEGTPVVVETKSQAKNT